MRYKKVLVLGSGALTIGQAGEFDYSGSQAIKALKEAGVRVVLVNPNIATIQTSEGMAESTYFLPVTPEVVERVIKKDKPDGILLSFGGQTALNCGLELWNRGVLQKYGVAVLGTPVKAILLTEDRELFAKHLRSMGIATPESMSVTSVNEAKRAAVKLGFPLMIRAAYALGGQNSGVVTTMYQLVKRVDQALAFSPQVLVEKYLKHFKEIEYEVVRDRVGNMVTVCNMENFDPLGIHTGESIVVAPSQTLTNFEYHRLREIAMKLVNSLGIVGECNVQFALNPNPKDAEMEYYVIEVNARLSRSSALASKATGYALAYVAARLGLGDLLSEIPNQVTKVTQSLFEPALDYVVVKVPRWDLDKFVEVEQSIGSSMKSVGEVMAIGRSFEEAVQKAVRMLDLEYSGVTDTGFLGGDDEIAKHIKTPTIFRLFAVVEAMRRGVTVESINSWSGIDRWFLDRLKGLVKYEDQLRKAGKMNTDSLRRGKELGFADMRIGQLLGKDESWVRETRLRAGIKPAVFQIDTLAGEFPAETNYLYMTYLGEHDDVTALGEAGVMVLGSGPYRIGSSVEFDWTTVKTAEALSRRGIKSVMVNCNPETVSTDYDMSSRLYFEELTLERVLDIYEFEQARGVIVSVGGQTPNNLVKDLAVNRVKILGTRPKSIDQAEDRNKFSALLDELEISQPKWTAVTSTRAAVNFAEKVGYPVLVRPSYVLSGKAMQVCFGEKDLIEILDRALALGKKHPVTISQFVAGAREIEYDAVAQDGAVMVYTICEHLEHAGVHSGDATIIYPPERLYVRTQRKILHQAEAIARALEITGPFNIQFLAKERTVSVIEVNLRASRTFPFVSKAAGVDLAEYLVAATFGENKKATLAYPDYAAVKVPQFSFSRLTGADPVLRVEMASTGEAAAFGRDLEEAYLTAMLSVGGVVPKKGVFVSLGGEENKVKMLEAVLALAKRGVRLFGTEKTAAFLKKNGVKVKRLYKVHEKKTPNVVTCFQKGLVDMAINIVDPHVKKEINDDYVIRRAAVDHNIFLVTNRQQAELFIRSSLDNNIGEKELWSWQEFQTRLGPFITSSKEVL